MVTKAQRNEYGLDVKPPHRSPAQVELTRADVVESTHIVDIVVTDREGSFESWGDPDRPVIPRSAIKSVQALPLITSGAADEFHLSDDELALACSSHSAEADHVAMVRSWLGRIGLNEQSLECGIDHPINPAAASAAILDGCATASVFNCCSGKHTGFLTTAVHMGEETAGYIHRDHPVQQRVEQAVSQMIGVDLSDHVNGVDGCGIPVFAIPLMNLALAMSRLVDPADLPDDLAAACRRLSAVLPSRSHFVSGSGRTETLLEAAASEPLIAKSGAEGVFMAALPDRGLGITLKARDGANRAAEQAIWGVLDRLGALSEPPGDTPITNKAGVLAGVRRVSLPR